MCLFKCTGLYICVCVLMQAEIKAALIDIFILTMDNVTT